MTLYCGIIGKSEQIIDDTTNNPSCPSGWITMTGERPSSEHIADENGNWVLRQLTENELSKEILQKRDELMEIAYRKIRVIEVDIKLANHNPADDDTPEKRNLTAWETYLSQLNKIEQQTNFPYEIDWPQIPEE